MESAWVAGAFGLIGSVIGAGATLWGMHISNIHQGKLKNEELVRERDGLLSAFAAELELIANITAARATVIAAAADKGQPLPSKLLRADLIGIPHYFGKLSDRVSAVPPALVEDIATAYSLCGVADAAIVRWLEPEGMVPPTALVTLSTLLHSAGAKCLESTKNLRAGRSSHC